VRRGAFNNMQHIIQHYKTNTSMSRATIISTSMTISLVVVRFLQLSIGGGEILQAHTQLSTTISLLRAHVCYHANSPFQMYVERCDPYCIEDIQLMRRLTFQPTITPRDVNVNSCQTQGYSTIPELRCSQHR
jgi:hypothetical protein